MIRVLHVRRQSIGGISTLSNGLVNALADLGIDVVSDDLTEKIPDKTGFFVDRKVTPILKDATRGFDLVHAWGYRAAWACAEAFGVNFPWIYTAWDWPKTNSQLLIDRLNQAKCGIVTSRAVKNELDAHEALNLELIVPGVTAVRRDRESSREKLGLKPDDRVVACFANLDPRRGLSSFCEAVQKHPSLRPVVMWNPGKLPGQFVCSPSADPWAVLAAADALVVPSLKASFSISALEAMSVGAPVIMRKAPGLEEMGVPGIHYHGFETDAELCEILRSFAADSDLLTSTVEPAMNRATDWLSREECARRHADLYRQILMH